jgi:hypothetical protein
MRLSDTELTSCSLRVATCSGSDDRSRDETKPPPLSAPRPSQCTLLVVQPIAYTLSRHAKRLSLIYRENLVKPTCVQSCLLHIPVGLPKPHPCHGRKSFWLDWNSATANFCLTWRSTIGQPRLDWLYGKLLRKSFL